MYYKLEDSELEKINEISKITRTDYELSGNFIPVESLMSVIEDLLIEIDRSKEELEDEVEQRENYYKPISKYEEVGMSERDFY